MQIIETSLSGWSSGLADAERLVLWDLVQDSLAWAVAGCKGRFAVDERVHTPALEREMATFVTLHDADGDLRGCIGTLEARAPLWRSVHENAVAAALYDPRFAALQPDELPRTHATLSLLSAMAPVSGPEAFLPGQHGIVLETSGQRAVFLPEVAGAQGWSREETLDALCRKAGLPAAAWRDGAQFFVFHSTVLSGTDACPES